MPDLTVRSVDSVILDVPLIRPHKFATTTATAQPILLVSVTTGDGVVGHGEGVVPGGPWWGGESVETMKVIVDRYLAPVVVGRSVNELPRIMSDLERVVANARFAKAAVDVALHDAWARSLGVPVHDLLGGRCRDSVEVTWALGSAPADEVLDEIEDKLESGLHDSFKLKMGALPPGEDTRRVSEIARALEGRASVRVDVNARWDRFTALTHVPRLVEAGVDLVEQPTPGDQIEVLAEITRRTGATVMADESVCSPHDALEIVRQGAADVIALKTTKVGGLRQSREVAAIAKAQGIALHGATSLEGPVGTAASLHFVCSEPGVNHGSELFAPLLLAEELLTEPLRYADGRLHLPEGPGLGVELDPDAVKRFTRT